jgi:uncharacterized protein (TIGR02266 family)
MDDRRAAERRRAPRIALNLPVRIATIDPETDPTTGQRFFRSFRDTCANLSPGGLFVETSEPLEPGRRILVELELPGGRDVEAVGRVAWIKKGLSPEPPRGVGVELLGGMPDQLATLRSWVSGRARKPSRDA